MPESETAGNGLLSSLRKLLDTGLATVQNRAELLAVEFQEEKDHAIELIMWVMALLCFALMTFLLLSVTIILIFPDNLRVYAAGGLALVYLAGGIWSLLRLRTRLKNRPIPFSSTIEEIKKDREWLLK